MGVKLNYNLSDIQEVFVGAGWYKARLIKAIQKLSKQNNSMIEWNWKIVTGKLAKGKTMKTWSVLKEGAMQSFRQHMIAFGYKKNATIKGNTDKLLGKYVILVVGASVTEDRVTGEDRSVSTVLGILPPDTSPALLKKINRRLAAEVEAVEEEDEDEEEDEEEEEEEDEDEEEDEEEEEDEDEDEEEEEEEEEDEPPKKVKKVKKGAKAKTKKKSKKSKGDFPF